jgi:hypothetical protein
MPDLALGDEEAFVLIRDEDVGVASAVEGLGCG